MKDKRHYYLTLKAWNEIYQPKSWTRLGLHKLKDINYTLLAKLRWSVASK